MRKSLIICSLLVLMSMLPALEAAAQTEPNAQATWGPPTYGTPVVHYVLQLSTDEGAWEQVATTAGTSYDLTLTEGHSYRIRVAGVDAEGRQGPFCAPSPEYSPGSGSTAPGQPGQPYLASL